MTKHFLNRFITVFAHKGIGFYCNLGLCIGTVLHKALEFELTVAKDYWQLFHITVNWTIQTDHAGPAIEFGILGLDVSLKIYDDRHWNYKKNRYYLPGEEAKQREEDGPDIEYGTVDLKD